MWWDNILVDRVKKQKEKVKTLDRMVAKLKDKFFFIDYMISLFRKLQNLRQKELNIREFTEELYRLFIRLT